MKFSNYFCILFFLISHVSGLLGQQRQDNTRPSEDYARTYNPAEQVDSTKKPPLQIFRLNISLDNDKKQVVDTFETFVHRVEPLYRSKFISGHLGSENSASYTPFLTNYNSVGLEVGHNQYSSLINNITKAQDVFDVNRSVWDIHYQKGYSIESSNVDINFYRRFNREILLNFNYSKGSDNSWLSNQENEFGNLSLKFYQDLGAGRRKSYLIFQKSTTDENHSRTLVTGENGISNYKKSIYGIGNRFVLKDSVNTDQKLLLRTELLRKNESYSFDDTELSTDESVEWGLSQFAISEAHYANSLSSWELNNSLDWDRQQDKIAISTSLKFSQHSTYSDTTSLSELIVSIDYDKNLAKSWHSNSVIKIGAIDAGGDFRFYTQLVKSQNQKEKIKIELDLNSLNSTLSDGRAVINDFEVWNNDFKNIQQASLDLEYSIPQKTIVASIFSKIYRNPIVPDEIGRPIQLTEQIYTVGAMLSKQVNWKILTSNHNLLIQKISDDHLLRPSFQLNGNFYINFKLFKAGLKTYVGADYYIIPSYKIPSFNPVFGSFYNDLSNEKSNHIVILNPYLSFKLDKFDFYVKANNSLSRLLLTQIPGSEFSGVNQYFTKDYNLYDFRVNFGLKWRLLD